MRSLVILPTEIRALEVGTREACGISAVREAGILDNSAHRKRVGDRDDSTTVGHDDVFPLPGKTKSRSLQSLDGANVRDSVNFRHALRRNIHFPQILLAGQTFCHFEVFADGGPSVRQGLLLGGTLRPAAGQPRAGNAIPLFCTD